MENISGLFIEGLPNHLKLGQGQFNVLRLFNFNLMHALNTIWI